MPYIIYKNKDGKRVPSFSTINAQWGVGARGLQYWYWKKGVDGLEFDDMYDADIGTLSHKMIDFETKGKELDLNEYPMRLIEPAKQCFRNWHEWRDRNNFKPIETELSLVSEEHQFGGTIDCIAMINDKLSLLDVKTGKEVYESQTVQLEAYKHLWDENFPDNPLVGGMHIIRTGKEMASFAHHFYEDFPQAWEAFLLCRRLYDLAKIIKKLK